MLVRARIKQLEQLPDWAKCCEKAIAEDIRRMGEFAKAYPEEGIFKVNLTDSTDYPSLRCPFCQHVESGIPAVRIAGGAFSGYVAIDCIDLDEGLIEDSHA